MSLDGEWTVVESMLPEGSSITVRGMALWGSVAGLARRETGHDPVEVSIRFEPGSRTARIGLRGLEGNAGSRGGPGASKPQGQ